MNKLKFNYLVLLLFMQSQLFAQIYTGFKTLNAGSNITLEITVDVDNDVVEIITTGPMNVFWGIGFDGSSMSGTYALISESGGNVFEQKLGNHNAGLTLANSLTTNSYTTSGGIATTTVTRPITGMNGDYFTFPSSASTFSVIWSRGNGMTLGSHAQRGATTISLLPECEDTFSNVTDTGCDSYVTALGETVTTSGTYVSVIDNAGGCDSTITLNLTIDQTYSFSETFSICSTNSYTFPDGTTQNNITNSLSYTSSLLTSVGNCDSIIVTNLNVDPYYDIFEDDMICLGDSYTFPDGQTINNITSVTVYVSELTVNNTGCDSLITTTINVTPINDLFVTEEVCFGDSFILPDGTQIDNITSNESYIVTLSTMDLGCDSVITTSITVLPSYEVDEIENICSGDSFTFPDGSTVNNITVNTEYISNMSTTNTGCDSTITTFINVFENFNIDESVSVCSGSDYTFPDGIVVENISEQMIYTSNLSTNTNGCDSIIVTTVEVGSDIILNDDFLICSGGSFTFADGSTESNIDSEITHVSNLSSTSGCDTVLTTTVGVSPLSNIEIEDVICSGDNYTFPDGTEVSNVVSTMTHVSNLSTNELGCDSIISVTLTITTVNVETNTIDATISADQNDAEYVWIDCDNDNVVIDGVNEQSFTATVNGNYAVVVSIDNCLDTSDCVNITSVGIIENTFDENISISPNPTTDIVNILFENSTHNFDIKITDFSGRIVKESSVSNIQSIQLNIEGDAGIYFVEIRSLTKYAVFKVIKL